MDLYGAQAYQTMSLHLKSVYLMQYLTHLSDSFPLIHLSHTQLVHYKEEAVHHIHGYVMEGVWSCRKFFINQVNERLLEKWSKASVQEVLLNF